MGNQIRVSSVVGPSRSLQLTTLYSAALEEEYTEATSKFKHYFDILALGSSGITTSVDLCHCHTQWMKRFQDRKDMWMPLKLQGPGMAERGSSVRSYSTISGILARSDNAPDADSVRDLQLWKIAFLWSKVLHFYPTYTSKGTDWENKIHEVPGEDPDLQIFKDLVTDGGLTASDILALAAFEPITTSELGALIGTRAWLLVLLTQLVRREIISVTPSVRDETVAMLQRLIRQRQAETRDLDSPDRHSASVGVMGTLVMETYVACIAREQTVGAQSANPPPNLAAAVAGYLDVICDDGTDFVDVRAHGPDVANAVQDVASRPCLRLTVDHIKTVRVLEHLADYRPTGLFDSNLLKSAERLLTKLDTMETPVLREAAGAARKALQAVKTAVALPRAMHQQIEEVVDSLTVNLSLLSIVTIQPISSISVILNCDLVTMYFNT